MNAIEIYHDTLSKDQCNQLIKMYDEDDRKVRGEVLAPGGTVVDDTIKSSTDLQLNFLNTDDGEYNDIILPRLKEGLDLFKNKYQFLLYDDRWDISGEYNIQKYVDGGGYYSLHCEHQASDPYRMLVFMIYLNDAECGTEFPYQNKTLDAKAGRLVLWPSGWTHPHKGVTPNKGLKYIATGWYSYTEH